MATEIFQSFLTTITQHAMLKKNDRVLLAVSGGPDSVAMTHLFEQIQDEYRLEVSIAHFNHLLRGDESDKDAEFVKALAARRKYPYFYGEASVKECARKNNLSEEMAARKLRYDFLIDIARRLRAKVATAHTLDDQAETVILRVLRGTGLRGLCGIYPVISYRGVTFIRPLLGVEKKDILEYMERSEFLFRRDSSNLLPKYLRNRVRLELLPALEEFNPSVKQTLAALSDNARSEMSTVDKKVDSYYKRLVVNKQNGIYFFMPRLRKVAHSLLPHLLQRAAEEVSFGHFRLEKRHISLLTAMIFQKKSSGQLQLAKNIFAERKDTMFMLRSPLCEEPFFIAPVELKINASHYLEELNAKILVSEHELAAGESPQEYVAKSKQSSSVKYLDKNRIKFPLVVRSRLPGDKMVLLGMKGEKNLKRLFIDLKIPNTAKQRIPVLADRLGPIAVLGYRIAERVKITRRTKRILRVEFMRLKPSKKNIPAEA